jgi:hypothetical protein
MFHWSLCLFCASTVFLKFFIYSLLTLKEMTSVFPYVSWRDSRFVLCSLCYVEYIPPNPSCFRAFIIKQGWVLSKNFSVSVKMTMWFSSLILFLFCITFIGLHMVNHPCLPGMKPTWSWCVITLICCWIWFAWISLRIFLSILIEETGL